MAVIIADNGKALFFNPSFGLNPIDISGVVVPSDGLVHLDFFDFDNNNNMDFFTRHITYSTNAGGFVVKLDRIRIFKNLGNFSFQQIHEFVLPADVHWVFPGDLNGDLFPDICLSNFIPVSYQYNFSAFINNNGTTFMNLTNVNNSSALNTLATFKNLPITPKQIWYGHYSSGGDDNVVSLDDPSLAAFKSQITSIISIFQTLTTLSPFAGTPQATALTTVVNTLNSLIASGKVYVCDFDNPSVGAEYYRLSGELYISRNFITMSGTLDWGIFSLCTTLIHEGIHAFVGLLSFINFGEAFAAGRTIFIWEGIKNSFSSVLPPGIITLIEIEKWRQKNYQIDVNGKWRDLAKKLDNCPNPPGSNAGYQQARQDLEAEYGVNIGGPLLVGYSCTPPKFIEVDFNLLFCGVAQFEHVKYSFE
ncbi:MAG: VCBS repeat-containing protein [Planctomycetes bacterium]|nr:VCBS repeat-containing protein [Planctomycetota bacterium]